VILPTLAAISSKEELSLQVDTSVFTVVFVIAFCWHLPVEVLDKNAHNMQKRSNAWGLGRGSQTSLKPFAEKLTKILSSDLNEAWYDVRGR